MRYHQERLNEGKKDSFIFYKRIYVLLLLPLSYLLVSIANGREEMVEKIFSLHIYRFISIGYSSITNWIPFSLGEIGIILGVVALTTYSIRTLLSLMFKKEERKQRGIRFLLNLSCLVSIFIFVNVMLCGLNYYRYPFSHYSGLEVRDSTVEELYGLCLELSNRANELRSDIVMEDENGVFLLSTNWRDTGEKARIAMNELSKEYPVLAGWNVAPKTIALSKWMSYTGITGIFLPFTMEANVNIDVLDYSIPATMCHELSHLRGFMKEEEANYIAYLACTAIEDAEFNYSGVMDALINAQNALYLMSREKFYEIRETYSEGVRRDLIASMNYWERFEGGVVSEVTNQINDTYLKANNQIDGVKSYGRMVDLLLAQYRQKQK